MQKAWLWSFIQDEPHVVAPAVVHRREVEAKGLETHMSLCAVSLQSVWLYEMLFSQPCQKARGSDLNLLPLAKLPL